MDDLAQRSLQRERRPAIAFRIVDDTETDEIVPRISARLRDGDHGIIEHPYHFRDDVIEHRGRLEWKIRFRAAHSRAATAGQYDRGNRITHREPGPRDGAS